MSKSKEVIALMIGRGGSSLKDKNILPVLGYPLLQWAASAAIRSKYIGRYYISSDCNKILHAAEEVGYSPILRPDYLSTDTAQSCDAVYHALELIEAEGKANIIVVQHANVGTITEKIIDECVETLITDPEISAIVPCHECSEYHPFRAKKVGSGGNLEPYINNNGEVSANRQDLPKALFFDHSVWVLRADSVKNMGKGQPPWPCMGNKIKPYVTEGCFDVHTFDDIKKTEDWIAAKRIVPPERLRQNQG